MMVTSDGLLLTSPFQLAMFAAFVCGAAGGRVGARETASGPRVERPLFVG